MPSNSSSSPTPPKRPSLTERTSSNHSLSSSAKQQHKAHRPHAVSHRSHHGRNLSHGKNLNKQGRLNSAQNLATEVSRQDHQRKRSGGPTVEFASPKGNIKRNSSHISLPKTSSHVSLRKNHSTTSLPRKTSSGNLKKQGLAPLTQVAPEKKDNTVGGFQLGDNSSDEGEAEWEDSSHSPENTRRNSAAREAQNNANHRHSSPPAPALKDQHKSAPSLNRNTPNRTSDNEVPPLLQHQRSARAPPAMSSISAVARPTSSTTLDRDLKKAHDRSKLVEPIMDSSGTLVNHANASTSAEGGVSHFINGSFGANGTPEFGSDDGYESPSTFVPNYQPQQSSILGQANPRTTSAQGSRRLNGTLLPSRTQQRLELQRRETMRSSTPVDDTDPIEAPLAIRTRSGSLGRGRSSRGDPKAAKRDYESAKSQLEVIKRFRNPLVEALNRLKDAGVISDGSETQGKAQKSRPVSRAGGRKSPTTKTGGNGVTRSHGEKTSTANGTDRAPSRGDVRFERQGSHDEIGLSRSHGDEDGDEEDNPQEGEEGVSAEEAMLRRMWESRDVYEPATN